MLFKKFMVLLFLLWAANMAVADDSPYHKTIDGMSVYLGVLPSSSLSIREHQKMHGEEAGKSHRYHIVVALFDRSSKKRIRDAKVKATVASAGMQGETRILEPMYTHNVSYGNYFTLYSATPYTVKIAIERPSVAGKSVVDFHLYLSKD